MNAARRSEIKEIITALSELNTQIETLEADEQSAFDNMPEGLQPGEKGQQSEAAIGYLSDAASSVSDAIENLTSAAL